MWVWAVIIWGILGTELIMQQFGKQVCPKIGYTMRTILYCIPQNNQDISRYAFGKVNYDKNLFLWGVTPLLHKLKCPIRDKTPFFFMLLSDDSTGSQLESIASICACMRRWTSWAAGCLAFFIFNGFLSLECPLRIGSGGCSSQHTLW